MNDADEFDRTMSGIANNEILIPSIRATLYDPTFAGFDIAIPPWTDRPYDGKFHPSEHSLWTPRQLYLYLIAPQHIVREQMTFTSVLAITAGNFWHLFLQRILLDAGVMLKDEVAVGDLHHNLFGHVDGLLRSGEACELKTINPHQVAKITTEDELRAKKPEYYSQAQDYLYILGLATMRFLFLSPSYPFEMREFIVTANHRYQQDRLVEYRSAITLAEAYPDPAILDNPGNPVPVCCAPGSVTAKKCPVRMGCPVGRMV